MLSMNENTCDGRQRLSRDTRPAFFKADDLSRRSNANILDTADAATVADYDVVIHLAAHLDKSLKATEQVFLTNVEGTVNLLRNVRQNAVFIFASTKDVYGRFADNYAQVPETCPVVYAGQSALEWSKLIAERYIEYYANRNSSLVHFPALDRVCSADGRQHAEFRRPFRLGDQHRRAHRLARRRQLASRYYARR